MPFSIDFYHFSHSGAIFWGRRCARLREQDRPISLMAYTTLRVVKPPFLGGHGKSCGDWSAHGCATVISFVAASLLACARSAVIMAL